MRYVWLIIFVFGWAAAPALASEMTAHCGSQAGPYDFDYCIHRTLGSSNRDIVFFFHGAAGNERAWLKKFQPIRDAWERQDLEAPIVATISYGPFWVLAEKKENEGGLLNHFMTVAMPFLEELSGFDQDYGKRILLGVSMGGFNVTQLVLKRHLFFDRAALLCPLITPVSFHSWPHEVIDFIFRSGGDPWKVFNALAWLHRVFPTKKRWEEVDPLKLADERLGSFSPRLFLTCGRSDDFGFFEGTEKLASIAQERRLAPVWVPMKQKGHCNTLPTDAVARFLSRSRSN